MADPVPAPAIDLDAIRARAEAATAGPWEVGEEWIDGQYRNVHGPDGFVTDVNELGPADAAFIAAARTDVPALAAELSVLRAREAQVGVLCADEHSEDEAIREHHAGNDGPWLARSVLAVLDGTTGSGKTG